LRFSVPRIGLRDRIIERPLRCGEHGDFEVTDTVRAILSNASLEQWVDAFAKAKRSTPAGELLRISSYKL
jgi:hypothetical protein